MTTQLPSIATPPPPGVEPRADATAQAPAGADADTASYGVRPENEPCPHCDGTGVRLVPPPPKKRGGRGTRIGRTHGYESTYGSGCRCDACRAAHREYARNWRARKVDPT